MANHSYVSLKKPLNFEEGEKVLRRAVASVWGSHIIVSHVLDTSLRDYFVWDCRAPGTSLSKEEAGCRLLAPGQDFGFHVWLAKTGQVWEFRHPINGWEYWAQAKIQHVIAHQLGIKTYTDDGSSPKREKVDPDSLKDTYRTYLCRNYVGREVSADVQDFHNRLLSMAPEGFRD